MAILVEVVIYINIMGRLFSYTGSVLLCAMLIVFVSMNKVCECGYN